VTLRRHAWLLGLLALAACGSSLTPRDKLVDAVTVFCDALRWQQYDQASNFLPQEARKAWLDAHDRLAELIEVSDLEITRRSLGQGDVATVVIALSWVAKNEQVVRKTIFEQRWEAKGDHWVMTRERQLRGDRLPGTRRPASAPATQRRDR
jgi:hypothetical protein